MTGEESLIFAEKRENGNSYLDSVNKSKLQETFIFFSM